MNLDIFLKLICCNFFVARTEWTSPEVKLTSTIWS